ncbi:MAG: protein-glutamate O-methyltransferase CheR [Armatimonadetes bacterium]|nr:protein-glutamate O-methyltransferase CheR [Armatimonadota bacterium]
MATREEISIPGFEQFAAVVKRRCGLDLYAYRAQQLERRLKCFMYQMGAPTLHEAAQAISRRDDALQQFIDALGINVTEFMRNRSLFDKLEKLLREMHARQPIHKLWSAGCSIGCEPYSLAIIMDRIDPSRRWQILASDIDREALNAARRAVFSEQYLKSLTSEEIRRYFTVTEDGWQFDRSLASRVRFSQMDLLRDPYPAQCDVILCRNVIIYLDPEPRQALLARLAEALRPGGILFIGGSESIGDAEKIGLEVVEPFFYRRKQRTWSAVVGWPRAA